MDPSIESASDLEPVPTEQLWPDEVWTDASGAGDGRHITDDAEGDTPDLVPRRGAMLRLAAIGLVLIVVLATITGAWSPDRWTATEVEMVAGDPGPADLLVPEVTQAVSQTTPRSERDASETSASSTSEPVPASTDLVDAGETPVPGSVAPPIGGGGEQAPASTTVTDPALVARPIPEEVTATTTAPSPWAAVSRTTSAGHVATDVGCASGTSAGALDAFFAQRIGPVLGHDYQHVYALGGHRYLWLFQDTFVDYSAAATTLDKAAFTHNTAMIQEGACFTLLHRGTIARPTSFEQGTGEARLGKWFWPMGGQTFGNRVYVFWAEMQKDGYDPKPPNGLGWHPARTWLAVYDVATMARVSFQAAPNSGVLPIYGYAVDSDAEYTYLFGNTFEQNLQREGGYYNGPHSATKMFVARVPLGRFDQPLQYRSGDDWTYDATAATPIVQRYWAENPMQPRYLGGQWVAVTKVDGYWGESLSVDVANDPWGPWTTTESRRI
ncbi:MAG TPA: hypothetical protein PLV68_03535, partial [Ilumatobacteraceae bacterium]|nr:hypothetical protein [Ilumatobacteraceae bacterium]